MSVVAATKGFVFFRRENMSNVAKKDGASYWIRVAIWLILSFAGWLTPAVGPVTDYGMKILFISACRKRSPIGCLFLVISPHMQ